MNDLGEREIDRFHASLQAQERLLITLKIFRMAIMFGMGYMTGLLTTLAILRH